MEELAKMRIAPRHAAAQVTQGLEGLAAGFESVDWPVVAGGATESSVIHDEANSEVGT